MPGFEFGLGTRRHRQCRVVAQDRGLELLEHRARFHPQLLDQLLPSFAVDVQRLDLPTGPVQRQHQACTQPLSQRMLVDEGPKLGHQLAVPTQCEVGVDTILQRCEPQLLEPGDLDLRERLVPHVGQRGPAPLRERAAELTRAASRGGRVLRVGHEILETMQIQLPRLDP